MGGIRRALESGEHLTFAHVRIHGDGITIGESIAPWRELKLVRFEVGKILLFRQSLLLAWRTIEWQRVPHPMILLKLIRERAPKIEDDDATVELLRNRRAKLLKTEG